MTLRSFSGSFHALCRLRWAGAAAVALVFAAAPRPARAASDDAKPGVAPDDDADEDAPKSHERPNPAGQSEPPPTQAPSATTAEPEPAAIGLVERLPPSAYPQVRALHGGSLWLSSLGLQWPYLPRTTIGVSGYAWLDTNYRSLTDGIESNPNRRDITAQGRAVLRVTPTYSKGDWFAQVQAELVANKTQTTPSANPDVDDLWIRLGKWQSYDLTVGRFEGFEVYHLGMGLDINTDERKGAFSPSYNNPPALYNAGFLYYRPDEASNFAVHAYPTDYLRFELLGQVGNSGPFNSVGVRPAAIVDFGWLKLRAAGEYLLQKDPNIPKVGTGFLTKNEKRGGAGSAQFVIDPYVEFGANVGYALVDSWGPTGDQVLGSSNTTLSYGGFLNAQPVPDFLVGFGANYVHLTDQHIQNGRFGEFSHLQTFGALQYFWENTVLVKLVVGYAKADSDATYVMTLPFSNKLVSARLRLQVLF
ncbi:MAG TPA: hypothetical protein VIK01_19925 [Polyangiaceae bacterium]